MVEPTVFEVRVGFVRVCLEEVRRFEVPREVVMVEEAMRWCALGGFGGPRSQGSVCLHLKQ